MTKKRKIVIFSLMLLVVGQFFDSSGAQESAAQVAVATPTPKPLDDETKCLALVIYWEGMNESRADQEAVAHTMLNRTKTTRFPDTICGVVSQKLDGAPKPYALSRPGMPRRDRSLSTMPGSSHPSGPRAKSARRA